MVNDIIEELLDLDMEPKLESLWWTSTLQNPDGTTLKVSDKGKNWGLPFTDVLDVLASVTWPWSVTTLTKVRPWETKISCMQHSGLK